MSDLTVNFAVYGALAGGNENSTQAIDVTKALQAALNVSQGIVNINNATMGQDPSPNNPKNFAALVTHNGVAQPFACAENQTVDFYHWIAPSIDLIDGRQIRNTGDGGSIYVTLDGALRHIPDPQTYTSLFEDGINIENLPNVDNYPIGTPITKGASLVKGPPDRKVFLRTDGGKRWIISPEVFDKFGFKSSAIQTLTPAELNAIPDGTPVI